MDKKTIVEAHIAICLETDEPTGFIYEPNLDFLILTAEKKKNKWEKAASYIHDISIHHPFQEGNKRTALATAHAILLAHGFDTIQKPMQRAKFMVSVPRDKKSKKQIESWLKRNYRKF